MGAVGGPNELSGDPQLVTRLAHTAFEHVRNVEPLRDLRDSTSLPLNANEEVRAITFSSGTFASRFSSSSEMPSEVLLILAADMFTNGSTAMDGRGRWRVRGWVEVKPLSAVTVGSRGTR